MKRIRFFMGLCLFCSCFAAAAPREVLHLVYVTSRDRAPLPGADGNSSDWGLWIAPTLSR
jgi:hypothetical protein